MTNSQLLLSLAAAVPRRDAVGRHDMGDPAAAAAASRSQSRTRALRIAFRPRRARGIAVIAATLIVAGAVIAFAGTRRCRIPVAVFGATLFIAAVGFADDVRSIPVLPRLLLQGVAVAAVILAAPGDLADRSGLPALDRTRRCCCSRASGS